MRRRRTHASVSSGCDGTTMAETNMIRSLLIANRGEIACRILRTARRMGMRTIAVYSDADASARHVREADEAIRIGPAPAAQSYLDIPAVIRAAQAARAEARSEERRVGKECRSRWS